MGIDILGIYILVLPLIINLKINKINNQTVCQFFLQDGSRCAREYKNKYINILQGGRGLGDILVHSECYKIRNYQPKIQQF